MIIIHYMRPIVSYISRCRREPLLNDRETNHLPKYKSNEDKKKIEETLFEQSQTRLEPQVTN